MGTARYSIVKAYSLGLRVEVPPRFITSRRAIVLDEMPAFVPASSIVVVPKMKSPASVVALFSPSFA